ncbi:3-hydroxyisobutyrate dehydrogenase [Patulibacter sp.]|uniref:3-hydroxyisobutyrate dehydrogenase n=1 Tax=Patulibacter sp. TaxID=1912859 RepID=UPI00271654C8|nr:3-hydroxyisobutyrate dehydrogenase [Patulibacter sp.]MDO9407267.1 3-hydroxyisobutyrate dehydrogenase [Patulibacter sp.]
MSTDKTPADTTIGFVGLGHMGGPMAINLAKAGYVVHGFDVVPEAVEQARAEGVVPVGSVAEAATGADVVITSLPNGGLVAKVYEGDEGVLANAPKGALLIDTSTIDVDEARGFSAAAETAGLRHLDAPVSGGVVGATKGTLAFMVGGREDVVAAAAPYFDVLGAKAVHCGDSGAGQAVKLCNNMLLAIHQIGVGEAFALAEKLGVQDQVFYDVASAATGTCWALNVNCPVPGPVPASPANRDYAGGFAVGLMNKDLGLALAAVEKNGVHAELGKAAGQIYRSLNETEAAGKDFSVVYEEIASKSGVVRGGGAS